MTYRACLQPASRRSEESAWKSSTACASTRRRSAIDGSFLTKCCDCLRLMGLYLTECVCYWVFLEGLLAMPQMFSVNGVDVLVGGGAGATNASDTRPRAKFAGVRSGGAMRAGGFHHVPGARGSNPNLHWPPRGVHVEFDHAVRCDGKSSSPHPHPNPHLTHTQSSSSSPHPHPIFMTFT